MIVQFVLDIVVRWFSLFDCILLFSVFDIVCVFFMVSFGRRLVFGLGRCCICCMKECCKFVVMVKIFFVLCMIWVLVVYIMSMVCFFGFVVLVLLIICSWVLGLILLDFVMLICIGIDIVEIFLGVFRLIVCVFIYSCLLCFGDVDDVIFVCSFMICLFFVVVCF